MIKITLTPQGAVLGEPPKEKQFRSHIQKPKGRK